MNVVAAQAPDDTIMVDEGVDRDLAREILDMLADIAGPSQPNFLSDITLGNGEDEADAPQPQQRPPSPPQPKPIPKPHQPQPQPQLHPQAGKAPYDAKVKDRRQVAEGLWLAADGTVELLTMRGNFWRVMGYNANRKNYLQPEEALLLVEKAQLCVSAPGGEQLAAANANANAIKLHIPSSVFYEEVLKQVPLPCYLTYVKLKSLEYVTMRHNQQQAPRAYVGDADIYRAMAAQPTAGLLDTLISFDIYAHTANWSKKNMQEISPTAYVMVQTGDWTPSARLMLRLLEEAKGVPVIFAAVLPSGNLILEEFTDARHSLDWQNVYARSIDMSIDLTKIPQPITAGSASGQGKGKGKGKGGGKLQQTTGTENGGDVGGAGTKRKRPEEGDDDDDDAGDEDEEEEEEEEEEDGGEEVQGEEGEGEGEDD